MLASLGEEERALKSRMVRATDQPPWSTASMRRRSRRSAELGLETLVTDTIMTDDAARARLADEVLRSAAAAAGARR